MNARTTPKILVVEDEAVIAELIERALEAASYLCAHAATLTEAEQLLAANEFNGVTLDLTLPGVNSLSWLECLALSDPALAAHTVVVTGSIPDDDVKARISACGAGFVQKPFELRQLRSMLERQIGRTGPTPGSAES